MSLSVSRNSSLRSFSAIGVSPCRLDGRTTWDYRSWFLLLALRPPDFDQTFSGDKIDLLAESQPIHRHQRVVPRIGRTAQRIFHEHGAKADIDGVEHGREHTDIGLGARHDHGTHPLRLQE